ncbi:MAG: hypothetical protein GC179_26320 [Anaerolineaceae bacterium]|nr:hypothetical protein [Anaerolineaceae bacterium]
MSQHEGTLIDKIAFLNTEQQERVLKLVEDIEAKEPSDTLRILVRFEPYLIEIVAKHPDRSDFWSGRGGGEEPVDALCSYLKEHHHLLVAKSSGERAFYLIGSLTPLTPERTYMMVGRNLDTGLPARIEISSIEVREQISTAMQIKIKSVAGNIKLIPKNMQLPEDILSGATIRIRGRYGHLPGLAGAVQETTGLNVVD